MERPLSQRVQSAAVVVPVLGLFLFMPPFVTLFAGPARAPGIPLIVAYIFGVWAVLLVATALLARRLGADEPPATPQSPSQPPPASDADPSQG